MVILSSYGHFNVEMDEWQTTDRIDVPRPDLSPSLPVLHHGEIRPMRGKSIDCDRFALRGCGCDNFMIFVIYIIIQIREYVYLNIIPKIDFRIVGRSCQRRRRRRRRLRGLAPLPLMPELQKFHSMVFIISTRSSASPDDARAPEISPGGFYNM